MSCPGVMKKSTPFEGTRQTKRIQESESFDQVLVRMDALVGSQVGLADAVISMCGAKRWTPGQRRPDLVLVNDQETRTPAAAPSVSSLDTPCDAPDSWAIPTVSVGPCGQIQLPGDEAILAQIIDSIPAKEAELVAHSSQLPRRVEHQPPLVIVVAGWQGGVGASLLAARLARGSGHRGSKHERSRVLVTLGDGIHPTGKTPDQGPNGVAWADLRTEEAVFPKTLIDLLPVIDEVPVLTADHRAGAMGNDPRLIPLIDACLSGVESDRSQATERGVVIDAGQWNDAIEQVAAARADMLILVGRGDQDSLARLARTQGRRQDNTPTYLVHTCDHPSPLLQGLAGPDDHVMAHPLLTETRHRTKLRSNLASRRAIEQIWREARQIRRQAWARQWREEES